MYEEALDWFYLREGEYHRLEVFDKIKDGLIRSQIFPGLQLAVTTLLEGWKVILVTVLAEVDREQKQKTPSPLSSH